LEVKNTMIGKRVIAAAGISALILMAASGMALARGHGGHGMGGNLGLLARAAGLTHSQIRTAFQNDTNLKTDRTNLKNAHEAVISCLLSGGSCTSQITAFSTALSTLATERMSVWEGLFKSAPNLSQASSVYSQLQQLQAQKKQIIQSIFSSSSGQSSSTENGGSSNGE
jgi:hypothetical protein